ncbi:Protein O-mannosyltransferase 2 [Mycoemilia scoparia]|uniref:Dolichyl-phosphate-mannose--protein mannosyltransferase n=1 Tax=Mycoemilia scoparia TaxID=417184 RepID=A0A9W8DWE1_9FUNG|nr:Protein O-mannosyltransferase 2 [Mycoemilia scoparia]
MSLFGPDIRQRGGHGSKASKAAFSNQYLQPAESNVKVPSLYQECEKDYLRYSTAYMEKLAVEGPRSLSTRIRTWFQMNADFALASILTIASLITRFYGLGKGERVIWDEAHFGKFGGYYVKHTFYHDVHPPLAKMLISLSEFLSGFDGKFMFDSGHDYPENVNYVFLRRFNAQFGSVMVPAAYYTMRYLGVSRSAAFVAAMFVCFDNALCTISRFILLDGILLCFNALTIMCMAGFHSCRGESFSRKWWSWLIATGVSIGCVASSKWVGFFTMAIVGVYTIYDLYCKFGDLAMPFMTHMSHWAARVFALLFIPLTIYLICFKIHFSLLYKQGQGSENMPSLFQAGLEGSSLKGQPVDIAYGSEITIKSNSAGIGLLHSHKDAYPGGSKQQQITCYGHSDSNNNWIVHRAHGKATSYDDEPISYVMDGDVIRLVHKQTNRNLHTHQVPGHITTSDWEVSAYGNNTKFPDPNDHWVVELIDKPNRSGSQNQVKALMTRFRLRSATQNCYLRASGKNLPQWAWGQAEVVCDRKKLSKDSGNIWNVEVHTNSRLPKSDPKDFNSNFFSDAWTLNVAMGRTNNALVPDDDKVDPISSVPLDWLFNRVGLRMCGWEDDRYKFFLIGNPVIWWSSTFICIAFFPLQVLYYLIRYRRGHVDFTPQALDQFMFTTGILWAGWFIHYFPYFIMGRVLYLHHYFPSAYFAMLLLAYEVDFCSRRLLPKSRFNRMAVLLYGAAAFANFMFFAPFTFGFNYSPKELSNRQWISTWKFGGKDY